MQYFESLVTVLSQLCVSAQQHIVLGDFNLPRIDWSHYLAPTEPYHDKFISFVNNTGLQQYVTNPTLANHVLDLVLTDSTSLISNVSVKRHLGKSDQNSVHLSVNLEYRCLSDNIDIYSAYYDYKRADYASLNYYIFI